MQWALTAAEAVRRIAAGDITSVELTTACLDRIAEVDGQIGAWRALDRDYALAQAEEMDDLRRRGRPLGALHGAPVAVKDLFDTAALPTGWGSPALSQRRPQANAAAISKLREAGAVIMGKTVTTELAVGATVATRNPHSSDHTSGGSSAGSAAAVASGQVPLAIGTQTYGSIIRPASFCGVVGFKPSRGLISRRGCLLCSPWLDQVGGLARTLEDAALLIDALMGYDLADSWTNDLPKPSAHAGWREEPPVEPNFAMIEGLPYADRLSSAYERGLGEIAERLGAKVEVVEAPPLFHHALEHQDAIHGFEFSRAVASNPDLDPAAFSPEVQAKLEKAGKVTEERYREAVAFLEIADGYFAAFFKDYDAILTPSATGEALPMGQGTGDPVCSVIWTFAGLPSLSLPWLSGESGLPLGVQIVAGAGDDARLMRTARWLEARLSSEDGADSQDVN